MGIFDLIKGNNKQSYPDWFDGELLKEGGEAMNRYSGKTFMLTALELSIYDFIYTKQMTIELAVGNDKKIELQESLTKAIEWFKENNFEAYEILIERSSSSQPKIKDKTELKEIKKIKLTDYYSKDKDWDYSNKSRDSEQLSKYRNFKFECEGKTIILGTHHFQQGDNYHNDAGSYNFYFLNKMNVFYNINDDRIEPKYKTKNEIKEVNYNFFNAKDYEELVANLMEYVWGTEEEEWEEDGLNNDEFYYEL